MTYLNHLAQGYSPSTISVTLFTPFSVGLFSFHYKCYTIYTILCAQCFIAPSVFSKIYLLYPPFLIYLSCILTLVMEKFYEHIKNCHVSVFKSKYRSKTVMYQYLSPSKVKNYQMSVFKSKYVTKTVKCQYLNLSTCHKLTSVSI